MNTLVDHPTEYFRQWIAPRSDLLKALEEEARNEQIPIVGPLVGKLLYLLARLRNAQHLLELGTAIGYSTLYLAHACRHTGGHLVSLELSETLASRARANIDREGLSAWAEVRQANALKALQVMQAPLDMIFMDIEKEDYLTALPACAQLLTPGGLLFVDNTGFKDAHNFNQAIFQSNKWEVVNLWGFLPGHSPEHDGLCLALRT